MCHSPHGSRIHISGHAHFSRWAVLQKSPSPTMRSLWKSSTRAWRSAAMQRRWLASSARNWPPHPGHRSWFLRILNSLKSWRVLECRLCLSAWIRVALRWGLRTTWSWKWLFLVLHVQCGNSMMDGLCRIFGLPLRWAGLQEFVMEWFQCGTLTRHFVFFLHQWECGHSQWIETQN